MSRPEPSYRAFCGGPWLLAVAAFASIAHADPVWPGYAGDPQHSALSSIASQPLQSIVWSTPVDQTPPGGTIFIHYGSPLITAANTVIVPVKLANSDSYQIDVRNGANGVLK